MRDIIGIQSFLSGNRILFLLFLLHKKVFKEIIAFLLFTFLGGNGSID